TAEMSARGIIPHALTNQLLSYDGLNDQLQEAVVTKAQQGISPRQLIQMLPTGLLTADDLTDELTFLGMRPSSQKRVQLVAPYLAARRERDNLRATLEAAYAAGLLSDADLENQLDGIEHNNNRLNLATSSAKWRKLIKITGDLEQEYSTLYV